MNAKTILFVAALMMAPTFAAAMGCGSNHEQAMSCGDGQVWDSTLRNCVDQKTS